MAPKLLPSSKSSSIIKSKKVSASKFMGTGKSSGALIKSDKGSSLVQGIIGVKVKVINVEKLIQNKLLLESKERKDKRKEDENNKREENKKKLKKKKTQFKSSILGSVLSKITLIDEINRFILFTLLGFIYNNIKGFIPQLIQFTKYLAPVGKFFEFLVGNFFENIVNLIDFGDKAYKRIRDISKGIGGEPFAKGFDDFTSNLTKFVNLALIVGMATMGGPNVKKQGSTTTGGVRLKPGEGGRPRVTKSGGGRAGGIDIRNPFRERPKVSTSGGRTAGEFEFRNPLRQRPKITGDVAEGIGGRIAKGAGRFSKIGTKGIPLIGPLIDIAIRTLIFHEPLGKAAAGAAGAAVGQAIGGWVGGTIGGIAGSVVPIIGNILGGAAGVTVGQLLGGLLGDQLGVALYDTIMYYANKSGKNVTGHAGGGKVSTRKGQIVGGEIKRSLKKTSRKKVTPPAPQKTIPGKDIGGFREIEKIFPYPPESQKIVSPLGTIIKSSKTVKEIPLVGGIMGIALDLVMGQKPDRVSYENFGVSIGNLIGQLVNKDIRLTFNDIRKSIIGMANGGELDINLEDQSYMIGETIGNMISSVIGRLIDDRITDIIKNISLELSKKPLKLENEQLRTGGEQGAGPEGPADFSGSSGAEKAMHYLMSQGLSAAAAAGIAGNLMQESGFNPAADNGGHHGIAQWDKSVRWPRVSAYIRSVGMNPESLEGQLVGLKWEAQGPEKPSWTSVSNASTAEQAAAIWLKVFERSGEKPGMRGYDNRIIHAKDLFSKYGSYTPKGGYDLKGTGVQKIIDLGKRLLTQGYYVGYNKFFDGYRYVPQGTAYVGTHTPGSLHYSARALDISGVGAEKLDQLYSQLKGTNPTQLIWRAPGHYDHLHIAYKDGGLIADTKKKDYSSLQMNTSYEKSSKVKYVITPIIYEKQIKVSANKSRVLDFGD
jgi:hypothetical protein